MTRQFVLWGWLVSGLVLVACELISVATHRRVAGFGRALSVLSSSPLAMSAAFLGWMWLGWHFFAR